MLDYIEQIFKEFSKMYNMIRGETKLIRKHAYMDKNENMYESHFSLARTLKGHSPLDMLKSLYEETSEAERKLNEKYRLAFFRKVRDDQQVRFRDDRGDRRDRESSRYDRHSRRGRDDRGSSRRDRRDRGRDYGRR